MSCFILDFIIGATFGLFVAALLSIAKHNE